MEGFGKRIWGKGEEDMINSILSEVIWTEVVHILGVMLVEGSIRTGTTSVPISVSLPHLCLYPYLSLLLCPASEAPGPLAPSQITGFLKNRAARIPYTFPKLLPALWAPWVSPGRTGISGPAEAEGPQDSRA